MNRYADDGLSNQDAPRRKLVMGIAALAAVLALGLALDAVACSQQGGGQAQEAGTAASSPAPADASGTGDADDGGATVVNGVRLLDAGRLSGFDDTMTSSLATALKSYASANGLDVADTRFRVTGGSATSSDATASLAIEGGDTELTATLGPSGWTVGGGTGGSDDSEATEAVSVNDADRLKAVFGDDAGRLKSELKAFLDASAPGSDVEKATLEGIAPGPGSASSSFVVRAGGTEAYGTYDPASHAFSFSLD